LVELAIHGKRNDTAFWTPAFSGINRHFYVMNSIANGKQFDVKIWSILDDAGMDTGAARCLLLPCVGCSYN
jgi:hypothetical protein